MRSTSAAFDALAREGALVEHVLHRVGVGDEPLLAREPCGERLLHRVVHLVGRHAARGKPLRLEHLDEGHHAVVGGEHGQPAALADARVHLVEEAPERAVEAQQVVEHLLAVRAVGVADHVARGEAHGQDVRRVVLAEAVALHCGQREIEQDLVGERRPPQIVEVVDVRRVPADAVGEDGVFAVPLPLHVVGPGVLHVRGRVGQQPFPETRGVGVGQPAAVPPLEPPGAASVYQLLVTKCPPEPSYQ